MLKLEVGKKYQDREGDIVEIVAQVAHMFKGDDDFLYTSDGKCDMNGTRVSGRKCSLDLVCEYAENDIPPGAIPIYGAGNVLMGYKIPEPVYEYKGPPKAAGIADNYKNEALDRMADNARELGLEYDPTGIEASTPGAKLDAGKNRLGLVLGDFALALQAVGEVGTKGAAKYSDHGWLSVPNGEARYADAMLRHHFAEAAGEKHDAQWGLLHAAHRAWNALALLELELRKSKGGK